MKWFLPRPFRARRGLTPSVLPLATTNPIAARLLPLVASLKKRARRRTTRRQPNTLLRNRCTASVRTLSHVSHDQSAHELLRLPQSFIGLRYATDVLFALSFHLLAQRTCLLHTSFFPTIYGTVYPPLFVAYLPPAISWTPTVLIAPIHSGRRLISS